MYKMGVTPRTASGTPTKVIISAAEALLIFERAAEETKDL